MYYQGLFRLIKANADGVRCAILFDNEEVGSRTKQGGAGMLLPNLIKRVYDALGYSNQEMDSFISKGFYDFLRCSTWFTSKLS